MKDQDSKVRDFLPLKFAELSEDQMRDNARDFAGRMADRRSVRKFSNRPIPTEVLENCLRAAGSAPSGANRQPWRFVVVQSPEVKREIRLAAENEEWEFYNGRAPQEWLKAIEHLGVNEHKPYLEIAPCLIAIFSQTVGRIVDAPRASESDFRQKNYYSIESTGIATGTLISALHYSGLAGLTHTPSPMRFLNNILGLSRNYKPFLLLVVGYPAEDCLIPNIERKPLNDFVSWV